MPSDLGRFNDVWRLHIMHKVVREINRYVLERVEGKDSNRGGSKWTHIDVGELKGYLGTNI